MSIENVYIARVNDGLILVASMEHNAGTSQATDRLEMYRNQAKQILKKLNPRMTSKMSVESNPFTFHYMIDKGICYLTLTHKTYPKRLAFLFLEDIAKEFENDLKSEHGDDWLRQVETVGRQYAFIKFDRVIQKKRREYSDTNSSANIKKLNDDLQSVQSIMRQTVDDVLGRGNKLDDISNISQNLASESKKYNWGAKKLSLLALYKQYAPLLAIGFLGIVILGIRYFWK
eukprot:gene20998-27211_t